MHVAHGERVGDAAIFEKRIGRVVARIGFFGITGAQGANQAEQCHRGRSIEGAHVLYEGSRLHPSQDVPVGGEFRWLTVRSPEGGETEVTLEPNANPAAKAYQEALFEQRIPLTAFEVDDVKAEFQRLRAKGVEFTTEPMQAGPVWIAVFSDTCGNLIQIYQRPGV